LTSPGIYHEPVLSRDGKSVVVSVEDPGKGQDVWILDATRKVLTRATFDPGLDGSGLLSPDGSTLFFASNRKGQFAIYKKPSTGVGNDVFVYGVDGDDIFPDSVSPDGRWLLVDHGGRLSGGRPSVEGVDLTGAEKPFRLSDSTGAVQHAQFSPDGKWVSYSSDESGRPEVYVQPFPATGGKWQVSTAGGDQSLWNMNGKEIFYLALDRRMMSVPVTAGTSLRVAQATPLFVTTIPVTGLVDERANYAVSPDGQHILINGLVEAVNEVPITVFLNWETSLRK
jgi:Tol biopolymer transport system component